MSPTDTTEEGLERRICRMLAGAACPPNEVVFGIPPEGPGGSGWVCGSPSDYDRDFCVDLAQLTHFLSVTQPEVAADLDLDEDGPVRRKFLARLESEVTRRGVVDVLRGGIKHGPLELELFYGTPSPGNALAAERFAANVFGVTRQVHYSRDEGQRSLDLVLFVNGLPVATFELKNRLTKQSVRDAVHQYERDRDPREKLFAKGRCAAHFAVDDQAVMFCTHLRGKKSWFLPFDKGRDGGRGNPVDPEGIQTDYLWRDVLTPESLTDILENFAQLVTTKDEKTGRKREVQIWPRYHQLDVVRRLLADAREHGAGRRYLIQHSAGSGKSNSIAWLAHQLIGLRRDDAEVFDSILVVTDRRLLDKQIRDTIKQFAQVGATVGHAERSGDLRRFLTAGKKVIISTVQKFPVIVEEMGTEHRDRRFAVLVDEAHSSQGGKTAGALKRALAPGGAAQEGETTEDIVNRLVESKKALPNVSYFAFTATPKNKTLELFGEPDPQPDGTVKHRPFHVYTMKQAIEEGFIVDVLETYTPVQSYYKLVKRVEEDPEFDAKRARKKLRRYVESHDHAIRLKAEIMADHFHDKVIRARKIGGEARAMVVTSGIQRAIQYFHALQAYLVERKSPYRAIVAFSGEHEHDGEKVTEASLNGFPSSKIADKIQQDPYRFLVCADKFQTGYDEPLLHTMYVDKVLSGIQAVQTLSRLNRAHPKKDDVFVLDFMNDVDGIRESFQSFYRTTILSEETDPNKLHDLKADLDGAQVYTPEQVEEFVAAFLGGADRGALDPILDACVVVYGDLDEDEQVAFKGKAKAFTRTYGFLSSVLDYGDVAWEKLSIFLNFLVNKLPAPVEPDLSRGILESIDMDSYRVEKKAAIQVLLEDEDAEVDPVPMASSGRRPEPELDRLSMILKAFNDQFGNIAWDDEDRVHRLLTEDIPKRVRADEAYQNALKNSDRQNARIEHDKAMRRVMNGVIQDDLQLFKCFMDDPAVQRWMLDTVFALTYEGSEPPPRPGA